MKKDNKYWKSYLKRYLKDTPETEWSKIEIEDILLRDYNIFDSKLLWISEIKKLSQLSTYLYKNNYIEKDNFKNGFLYKGLKDFGIYNELCNWKKSSLLLLTVSDYFPP